MIYKDLEKVNIIIFLIYIEYVEKKAEKKLISLKIKASLFLLISD